MSERWARGIALLFVLAYVGFLFVPFWAASPWLAMPLLTWGAFWYAAVERYGPELEGAPSCATEVKP